MYDGRFLLAQSLGLDYVVLTVETVRIDTEEPVVCTTIVVAGGFQLWLRLERGSSRTEAMWVHVNDERVRFVAGPFRPERV